MEYDFSVKGEIIEWRGPAPFTFLRVDAKQSALIKKESHLHTYGWGVLYMHGILVKTEFSTTLMPKDGQYLIPIKVALKKAENVDLGDVVTVKFNLGQADS
jgi:hypothetical protein